jgi:hypothetical protein
LFQFNDNTQDIIVQNLTYLNSISMWDFWGNDWTGRAYTATFDALAKLLEGNVTLATHNSQMPSIKSTSGIVSTGLTSTTHTSWNRAIL